MSSRTDRSDALSGAGHPGSPFRVPEEPQGALDVALPSGTRVGIVLSHDIDHLGLRDHLRDLFLPKQLGHLVLQNLVHRFRPIQALKSCAHIACAPFGRDAWNVLPDLLNAEEKAGVRSTYFVATCAGRGIAYREPELREAIAMLAAAGQDVQLHGQHLHGSTDLRDQVSFLSDLLGREVRGVRMHYLRIDDSAIDEMEALHLRYDSSFYAPVHQRERSGQIFRPWMLRSGLIEAPLNVMDSTLFSYRALGMDYESAIVYTQRLLDEAARQRGVVTVNLHPNYYSATHPDVRSWYDWLLREICTQPDVWVGSFSDYLELVGGASGRAR